MGHDDQHVVNVCHISNGMKGVVHEVNLETRGISDLTT